jgi:hypothetical protein
MPEAQAYLDHWEERWADTRIHGTTKRQVAAMFAEEKPALQTLPIEPFRYYQYGERAVHLGGCVKSKRLTTERRRAGLVSGNLCNGNGLYVRLLDRQTGQLLREHLRQERGRHRIKDEDRSKRTPLGNCTTAGTREKDWSQHRHLLHCTRAKVSQPCAVFKASCRSTRSTVWPGWRRPVPPRSIELEAYDYRFVRRYLERRSSPPASLRQVDPLIRQLTVYRDLIEERTKETNE